MKAMLKRALKGVPEAEREKLIAIVEKNPELFTKIGEAVQQKMKHGKDQSAAVMEAVIEFKDELTKIMR